MFVHLCIEIIARGLFGLEIVILFRIMLGLWSVRFLLLSIMKVAATTHLAFAGSILLCLHASLLHRSDLCRTQLSLLL